MYSPYEPSSQRIVTGGPGPQQARNHRECGAAVARARTEALTVARKLQLDRTAAVHTHELADRPYLLVVVLPALQVLRGDPDLRGGGAHAMSGSTGAHAVRRRARVPARLRGLVRVAEPPHRGQVRHAPA